MTPPRPFVAVQQTRNGSTEGQTHPCTRRPGRRRRCRACRRPVASWGRTPPWRGRTSRRSRTPRARTVSRSTGTGLAGFGLIVSFGPNRERAIGLGCRGWAWPGWDRNAAAGSDQTPHGPARRPSHGGGGGPPLSIPPASKPRHQFGNEALYSKGLARGQACRNGPRLRPTGACAGVADAIAAGRAIPVRRVVAVTRGRVAIAVVALPAIAIVPKVLTQVCGFWLVWRLMFGWFAFHGEVGQMGIGVDCRDELVSQAWTRPRTAHPSRSGGEGAQAFSERSPPTQEPP